MFSVVESLPHASKRKNRHVYLQTDDWDDWEKYRTMFSLFVVDDTGQLFEAGSVKIGEVDLKPQGRSAKPMPGFRAPTLKSAFKELSSEHFSLGQNENYYETLNALDRNFRETILIGLRDCAFDLQEFDAHIDEYVMSESLLRHLSSTSVRGRYHRLAHGDTSLTPFGFEFALPSSGPDDIGPPVLSFHVVPDSEPPTNIHVLIGRNGVGKSHCVQRLSLAVLGLDNDGAEDGVPAGDIWLSKDNASTWAFAGLVFVSFSIFDKFDLPRADSSGIKATQVGLRYRNIGRDEVMVKTPEKLAEDFSRSLGRCRTGPRAFRLRKALQSLESDPLFGAMDIGRLLRLEGDEGRAQAIAQFLLLSSGHAIVLLTLTRLVELVDERTLVILDEPESHLHPPLLSAFIRAVGDLLVMRNGLCLIATHSPVVLQEVPRSCAWKLGLSGELATAERPSIETFGESIGVLTREVFVLEVTETGFHGLLRKALDENGNDYDRTVEHFGGQLGTEAKAILMGLAAANRQALEG